MSKPLSGSYVVSDILSDDTSNRKGLTTGHYKILLSLEEKSPRNFIAVLLESKISRDRLWKNIHWLLSKKLIRLITIQEIESYSISEKGSFLLALFREYETGAEEAESNVNVITPFTQRLKSTQKPIGEYLKSYAQEYETIGNRFILKARQIRDIISSEPEE